MLNRNNMQNSHTDKLGTVAHVALMSLFVVVLTAGSVGACVTIGKKNDDKKESKTKQTENVAKPKKTAIDTMLVEGNLFSPQDMRSCILLIDKDGKQIYSVHHFPDDMILSQAGDTVLYDNKKQKIVENLTQERNMRQR